MQTKIKSLIQLYEMGLTLKRNDRKEFENQKKKGSFTLAMDNAFLCQKGKIVYIVIPKEKYALNWDALKEELI